MSQHCYCGTYSGAPVVVVLGWDRPIGHFFMVVTWDEQHSTRSAKRDTRRSGFDEDDVLYSNLNERMPFDLSLDHFKAKLTGMGITVPESMFEQVNIDRVNRTGNRTVWYADDGTFREM